MAGEHSQDGGGIWAGARTPSAGLWADELPTVPGEMMPSIKARMRNWKERRSYFRLEKKWPNMTEHARLAEACGKIWTQRIIDTLISETGFARIAQWSYGWVVAHL